MSRRFNVAILRSAIGTPSDPSSKLQEFEEEFIGLPLLMAGYQTRRRPESALQRDDVIPTPLDNIQSEESVAAQPTAAAAIIICSLKHRSTYGGRSTSGAVK
eukprot:963812-Amphidinium_carterae.1